MEAQVNELLPLAAKIAREFSNIPGLPHAEIELAAQEALEGNLADYHSIRINDQWRIVFAWTDHGPAEVTICDYH